MTGLPYRCVVDAVGGSRRYLDRDAGTHRPLLAVGQHLAVAGYDEPVPGAPFVALNS